MYEPEALTTVIGPLIAPLGTTAVSAVSVAGGEKLALTPLKRTAVVPVKCTPKMLMESPTLPDDGVKSVMYGPGPTNVNAVGLLLVPMTVATLIGPVLAPAGTNAVI